jgi:hypothetical protein
MSVWVTGQGDNHFNVSPPRYVDVTISKCVHAAKVVTELTLVRGGRHGKG